MHELVPIVVISVINYTDAKILKPTRSMQEKPDIHIDWIWEEFKPDIKKLRRRSPVGENQRFAIYQRDEFRCYYCKRHKDELPKGVRLELDHKIPYSDGGDDSFQNLVTACSDCNRGKSNKVVKDI
jgi:CRISPR/Cas system Type II protein with McrA/HNH and RuvC-like nuclease domain